jgi:hypothetical protein
MNRDNWLFTYTAGAVLDAAKAKVEHHGARAAWWLGKREGVLERVKSEGIEIDESLAAGDVSKFANTYARQPGAMIRQDLLNDIGECNAKVAEHRTKLAGYEAWVEMLGADGGVPDELELDHADWTYFFSTR